MSIDVSAVGTSAAELMDEIAADYADDPTARVGVVAIVVEIDCENETVVEYRCSDVRRWIQAGLFRAAARAVEVSSSSTEDDDA